MAIFNFFGDNEHRVFNYKPIYYDREKEELKRRFGAVDGSYVPGSYIKGSFRDGAYKRSRNHLDKLQTIIGIVTLILVFAVLYFIAKFYSLL